LNIIKKKINTFSTYLYRILLWIHYTAAGNIIIWKTYLYGYIHLNTGIILFKYFKSQYIIPWLYLPDKNLWRKEICAGGKSIFRWGWAFSPVNSGLPWRLKLYTSRVVFRTYRSRRHQSSPPFSLSFRRRCSSYNCYCCCCCCGCCYCYYYCCGWEIFSRHFRLQF